MHMSVRTRTSMFMLVVALLVTLPASTFAALQKGQPAPPFKVVTTSGQQVTLANYQGYVLIMDFFATWCRPCQESIHHLTALNNKLGKKGLQILGMSVDEGEKGEKAMKEFIPEKKINYPVALINEEIQSDYAIRSIPTMYVINKKGIVVDTFRGYSDETARAMEALIKKLLAEKD